MTTIRPRRWLACVVLLLLSVTASAHAQQTYRLYEGLTAYVLNEQGSDFTLDLDVRDLNLFASGPREILFKVYGPDGQLLVREIIPDDGVTSPNFPDRIGGWDHELQYYANLYVKGTLPSFRWSAWSDPARLATIVPRRISRQIKGAGAGRYRIVLAGTTDHYVTMQLSPQLPYGVAGHTTFLHGHGDMLRKSYVYVPKGSSGIFFAAIEPDQPRTRVFKLTGPDGRVLFEGAAAGGYVSVIDGQWQQATIPLEDGAYDGQLLTLEVSPGAGDYLVKVSLQQPRVGPFKDYTGQGSTAVFASDPQLARALAGGTMVVDDQVFWHPFQVRFHQWLKANPLDADDAQMELRKQLELVYNGFRLLETSDGRGSTSWSNWAYGMGYYGFKVFRPAWLLLTREDLPQEVRSLLIEGLIMAGDRLSFAAGVERVNGNAFAQIPVALWYCHQATGDAMQKERFEVFFDRWANEGWGPGAGLSRSGDAQEHFAHDMHYGSYLLDNWVGDTWVQGSILEDASSEPRFAEVIDRYRELYSYLYCREANGKAVAANPWSARTHMSSHKAATHWELDDHTWKGEPGPDFTVSVNGGNEWFAARRPAYYALTFHGRLAPEWMSQCFPGQLGFGGGTICQITVPGRGPVIASTLGKSYGEGMHPSQWRDLHVHSIVGETWDGRPLIAAISEHENAELEGDTVTSSGEVRNAHVKVSRSYIYHPDRIDCTAALATSDYAKAMSLWSHGRLWSEVQVAYEMIPFMPGARVTLIDGQGVDLGELAAEGRQARRIRIDRGGFGVEIELDQDRLVQLGNNDTVMVRLTGQDAAPTPAEQVKVDYSIKPFNKP